MASRYSAVIFVSGHQAKLLLPFFGAEDEIEGAGDEGMIPGQELDVLAARQRAGAVAGDGEPRQGQAGEGVGEDAGRAELIGAPARSPRPGMVKWSKTEIMKASSDSSSVVAADLLDEIRRPSSGRNEFSSSSRSRPCFEPRREFLARGHGLRDERVQGALPPVPGSVRESRGQVADLAPRTARAARGRRGGSSRRSRGRGRTSAPGLPARCP